MESDSILIQQGKRLTELRKKLGYDTIEAFGEYIGNLVDGKPMDKGTISKYESGQKPTAPKILVELISTHNLNIHWFRRGDGGMFLDLPGNPKPELGEDEKDLLGNNPELDPEKLMDEYYRRKEDLKQEVIDDIIKRLTKDKGHQ